MQLNTENVLTAAAKLDVRARQLPGDFIELELAGRKSRFQGADFEFERLIPWLVCGDKALTSMILSEHGLPVARHACFGVERYAEAVGFLRVDRCPVVTKPARGTSGGAGVTLNIIDEPQLRGGFARARAHGPVVMLEDQVNGENLRLTVLADEVLGVVRRIPAHVVGDGASSVKTLVSAKNELWRSSSTENRLFRPIELDAEARRILARQGLHFDSVPARGLTVELREASNADQGGEVEEVTSRVHQDYVDMALAAAGAVGTTLCGVDLIVTDCRVPAAGAGAVINEVNTTPALYIANGMVDGAASTYAAECIVRRLFDIA